MKILYKTKLVLFTTSLFIAASFSANAQSVSEFDDDFYFGTPASSYNDDDLFGAPVSSFNDDDLFGTSEDDDFFFDDGIEEWTPPSESEKQNLGLIFESGSVKFGGSLSSSFSVTTTLYEDQSDAEEPKQFSDFLKESAFSPTLKASLYFDARPSQTLRLYGKFNTGYPFDGINVSEMFTDFSVTDNAFFRFGVHTVSMGTGFFYSPVSDLINTSSIDPQNTSEQVSGSLNLRTQIVFPGTQNCLWLYAVPARAPGNVDEDGIGDAFNSFPDFPDFPDEDDPDPDKWRDYLENLANDENVQNWFANQNINSYMNFNSLTNDFNFVNTAMIAKYEFVTGGWELGIGAKVQYQYAPVLFTTFSGSIFSGKVAVFGEGTYQRGAASQWTSDPDKIDGKTDIFRFTAGFMYMPKDTNLTLAGQYYYNSNDIDLIDKIGTHGHNFALNLTYSKLFDNDKLSLNLLGITNIGHKNLTVNDLVDDTSDLTEEQISRLEDSVKQINDAIPGTIINLTLNWAPFKALTFSAGPSVTLSSFSNPPKVTFSISGKLGGGSF